LLKLFDNNTNATIIILNYKNFSALKNCPRFVLVRKKRIIECFFKVKKKVSKKKTFWNSKNVVGQASAQIIFLPIIKKLKFVQTFRNSKISKLTFAKL